MGIEVDDNNPKQKRLLTTAMLIIGIGLLAVLVLSSSSTAATYDWWGIHTVSGTESYNGDTINAHSLVVVPNGATLRLNNTDLNMQPGAWQIDIQSGGTLEVGDNDNNNGTTFDASVISFRGDMQFFDIDPNSNVLIENSEIEFNPTQGWYWEYWVDIQTNNITWRYNSISGYDMIYMSSSNTVVDFNNNTFYNGNWEIYASNINTLYFTDNWVFNAAQYTTALYTRETNLYMSGNVFESNRAHQIDYRGINNWLISKDDTVRSTSTSGPAFRIYTTGSGTVDIDIDNINISNNPNWGLYLDGNPSNRITGYINNSEFYNNGGGIWMDHTDIQIFDMDMNLSYNWHGIDAYDSSFNITDSKIFNSNEHQIETFDWSTAYDIYLENVEIAYGTTGGIRTNRLNALWVSNSSVHHNDYTGIYMTEVTHVDILNTDVYNDYNGAGIYGDNMYWVNITDGDLSDNNYEGVHIRNVNGFANILGNTVNRASGSGIHVYYVQGLIQDNTIDDTSGYGIYGENSNLNYRINIDGNTIRRSSSYGIHVYDFMSNITDNTIRNSGSWQMYLQYLKTPSIVNDNDIRNGPYGIYSDWSYITEIDNNIIYNHTSGRAAHFYYNYEDLVFTNNDIQLSRDGVYYYSPMGITRGMTFDNNTIENTTSNHGFYCDFYGYDRPVSIQNNDLMNNYQGGIYCTKYYNYDALYIRNNYVYNSTNDYALRVYNPGYYARYAEFSGNTLKDNRYGMYISYMDRFEMFDNTISGTYYTAANIQNIQRTANVTDNHMYGNSEAGWYDVLYIEGDYNGYPVNFLRNNISDNNNGYGIDTYGWGNCLIEDNILNNNGYGAYIEEVDRLISRNNEYNGNSEYGYEIYDVYGDVIISNDSGNNNGYEGLYIEYIYGKVSIDNSSFNGNSDSGIYAYYIYNEPFSVETTSFEGNGYGIYTYRTYYGTDIHDCYIANNTWYGLELDRNDFQGYHHVYDNEFYSNNYHFYSYDSDVLIEDNTFERGSYGVEVYSDRPDFFIFRNNTMEGIPNYGLYFEYQNYQAGSGIYDNTFRSFGEAIYMEYTGTGFPIFNNLFTQGQRGIYMEEVSPHVHHNTFKILSEGIYCYRSAANIEFNTFANSWNYGIYLEDDRNSQLSDNTFTYSQMGVFSEGSSVSMYRNTFGQNQFGAVLNASFATLVDNDFHDNSYGLYVGEYAFVDINGGDYTFNSDYGIWSDVGTFSSWNIDGDSMVTSSVIVLNGHLTVDNGGTLTLEDTKIQLRSFGGLGFALSINDGGSLMATDSVFEPVNKTKPFGLEANAGSSIMLDQCDLVNLAGGIPKAALSVMTSDTVLEKVNIIDSVDAALYIDGGVDFTMRNGTISNSGGYDVHILNDSILRMGNTEFDQKNVLVLDTSKIIIERVISVKALDDGDLPYKDVLVTVTDDQDNEVAGLTDAEGMWWQFFEGAIISSTGMADTDETYEIEVTDGDQTFTDAVHLTDDFVKTYRFGLPPVVLNGTSSIVMDEDTVYTLDMSLYFFDNDMLTYSAKGNTSLLFEFNGEEGLIIPAKNWYGNEDLFLVATDTHDLSMEYALSVTVNPVNDIPTLSGVPDLTFNEDEVYELDLLPFIDDPDTPQSGLTVSVDTMYGTVLRTTVTFNFPDASIQYVRLMVSDADGGTSQDILISVLEINDPPVIEGIPIQNATEDIQKTVDLATWLVDDDDNVSTLVLTSDSEFVVRINGTKVTFLFPDGPRQRFVPIMVSDGEANMVSQVEFSVDPVNDPPEIAPLPLLTVTEGEDYIFDVTEYLSDIDNDTSELYLVGNSTYVTVDGLTLIINVDESSVLMTLTITVSDGDLQTSAPLRITIEGVNDPPTLTDPKGPGSGAVGDDYKFKVTFTDPDAENPVVFVVINGERYAMKHVSGDFDTGALFEINLKTILDPDDYTYRFEAEDGSGEPNGFARTQDFTNLKVEEQANYWWIIVIIIIIAVVAVFLLMRRPKQDKSVEMLDSHEDEHDDFEDDHHDDHEDDLDDDEDFEDVDEDDEEPVRPKKERR